ncbi:hypothetical protein BDF21DRAFT_495671 [Thamnidium elegans]|nr:hypothetical protein BDF21DRAFT_495671 [Thamnidium elegans]
MVRLWNRLTKPFRREKKKRLPTIVFDEYAKPPSYLKESIIYNQHLVRIDKLEKAYTRLLTSNKKSYWKSMDPFIQIWYHELDRVCQHSQNTLILLKAQLEELSHSLCAISSPLKNRDRQSLRRAQQFITTCLKEWDSRTTRTSSSIQLNSQSLIIGSSLISNQSLFSETTLLHENDSELQDSRFQLYYKDMEGRIQQELESNKNNPRLRQCISQVYRLEQDIYLYHHYITSQFSILWDLGSISLGSLPDLEEPSLYQVMKMKWEQKYNMQIKPLQTLEESFKTVLKSNTPNREDFTCAVCLCILHEPTTLAACHHTFCRSCIQHLYCAHCHRYRTKTINRISENLLVLVKPLPAVYCTCQSIDSVTGELTLKNQHEGACPLCRTAFKPQMCTADVPLEKFISLYFPKRRSELEDEVIEKPKKRSVNDLADGNRRRSQVSKGKFYSKMQRWSTKWVQGDLAEDVPPVPRGSSQRLQNDMLFLARRSWMF